MRHPILVALMLSLLPGRATAQVSIQIGMPNVAIGVNLPAFPQLVQVPEYPVYYAPALPANYFFYDGMYWVFENDTWYASAWFNGPWSPVPPQAVPVFLLRVPVRYYRQPPAFFGGWRPDAPPRWDEHWGPSWAQRHAGWNRWDRKSAPPPAPLPVYQRSYAGSRYPSPDLQPALHGQNYPYWPRDKAVQRAYVAHAIHGRGAEAREERPGHAAKGGERGNHGR
jgi:hypothetical protein